LPEGLDRLVPGNMVRHFADGKYNRMERSLTIEECRQGIDRIDGEILDLLNERARLASTIGKAKQAANQPVFVPEREQAVLDGLNARNSGPLSSKAVGAIFRAIITEIRSMEIAEREEG